MADSKALIRRYYSELWNEWSMTSLEELISPDIVFRGSIGTAVKGIDEFKQYVNRTRSAFPDFRNHVEELIAEGERVVARLSYSGTHQGELFGFSATGVRIAYQGIAIFHFKEDKIVEGYVLGDTESLKRQLVHAQIAALARELPRGMNISLASEAEQEWAADLMSRTEPWKTLGRTFEASLQAMRDPYHSLFIARGEVAEPRGFMLVHPEGFAGSPYIKSIAVDETFRGAGIGTHLLRFADLLFQRTSPHIFLCVSSFNIRARALYERRGYEIVGELKGYIIPEASEFLMHKSLWVQEPPTVPRANLEES